MHSRNKYFPKEKGDLITTIGLFVFIVAKLLQEVFPTYDPFLEQHIPNWGIRVLRDIGFAVTFSSMIIFGIRKLGIEGFTIKRVLSTALGIAMLFGVSAFCFYASTMMVDISKKLNLTELYSNRPNKLKYYEKLTLEKKAEYSLLMAEMQYEATGELIEYFTTEGKIDLFKPNEQNINKRNETLHNIKKMDWLGKSLKQSGFGWAVIASLSIFLGFYPKKSSNNAIKRME
jgi:hypothetical protein